MKFGSVKGFGLLCVLGIATLACSGGGSSNSIGSSDSPAQGAPTTRTARLVARQSPAVPAQRRA